MRIVMMGTGPFAVPTFVALLGSEHQVPALITRPLVQGRKASRQPPNPTREAAVEHNVMIHDPASINSPDAIELLQELQADLFVVCDYGQILSSEALSTSRLGGINLHGSLLPKYRGAAPINWAIYDGEQVTGVTVIHMTPKLDGGPCLAKQELEIETHESTADLEPRLAELGPNLILRSIDLLSNWDGESNIGELQDQKLATKAPRLKKSDGLVDWNRTATQICNQVRAFKPWPGTFTFLQRESGEPLRVIIETAIAKSVDTEDAIQPGTITHVSKTELGIRAGNSTLFIEEIQPAGKRVLAIEEFLRGRDLKVGQRFTSGE